MVSRLSGVIWNAVICAAHRVRALSLARCQNAICRDTTKANFFLVIYIAHVYGPPSPKANDAICDSVVPKFVRLWHESFVFF